MQKALLYLDAIRGYVQLAPQMQSPIKYTNGFIVTYFVSVGMPQWTSLALIMMSVPASPCAFFIYIRRGIYFINRRASYRKISWRLEAARFGFRRFQSLWNLTGTSAAALPRCPSNFRAMRLFWYPISWLRDFTRFGGKTCYRLVNRGSVSVASPAYDCPSTSKVTLRYFGETD